MRHALVIEAYNEAWPRMFEAEREVLERVLAPWAAGGIHHVGSTAVPGLPAKPVIDMIAGVASLEGSLAAREPLAELGYVHGEHRPEAHWFRKPATPEWWRGTHSLHLTEPGSDLWRERLSFRDALRDDPALVAAYGRWKLAHARRRGDSAAYDASKTPLVAAVLATRGLELRPDRERLSPAALAARAR